MDWLGFLLLVALLLLLACGWLVLGARAASRDVAALSERLWASAESSGQRLFYETQVAELPDIVLRYFQWSLADGTPIPEAARLRFSGRIRLGRNKPWMPHRSQEVIRTGEGFVWSARVTGALPISGSDSYVDGSGKMEWRLARLLPVMRAADDNIARSARWRFVAEHLFIPGSLLPGKHVCWEPLSDLSANVTIVQDGIEHTLRLDFDADGMPRKVTFQRWGAFETEGGRWKMIPYAVRCRGVCRKGGYSLPHQFVACWWANTDQEFAAVELEVEDADFR